MFLLVSVCHVGAHRGEHQHGVSIQISIILGKTFLRISRIRNIPLTWILARVFVYVPPFISHGFWTLSTERFWFLFWSTLNGVTLKSSNSCVRWGFPPEAFPEIEVTQRPNKGKARLTINKGLFGVCAWFRPRASWIKSTATNMLMRHLPLPLPMHTN